MNAVSHDLGWIAFAAAAAAATSAALMAALTGQLVCNLPAEDRQYRDVPPYQSRRLPT